MVLLQQSPSDGGFVCSNLKQNSFFPPEFGQVVSLLKTPMAELHGTGAVNSVF